MSLRGVYIPKLRKIFSFGGPKPPPLHQWGEIWRGWKVDSTPNFTPSMALSNLNTAVYVLGVSYPVGNHMQHSTAHSLRDIWLSCCVKFSHSMTDYITRYSLPNHVVLSDTVNTFKSRLDKF